MDPRPVPIPIEDGLRTSAWPLGLKAGSPAEAGLDPARLEVALALLAEEIGTGRLAGAVAVVARRGIVAAHRSLGWAQLQPDRRAMAPDTVFDLASLTKVMATLPAALLLLERGAFRLDDPVALFLPGLAAGSAVRVRHLLTHTAGLPPVAGAAPGPGREALLEHILATVLEHEPGDRAVYSDVGFILLGRVVEQVTGWPLDRVAREMVLGPLGLREAGFNPPPALRQRCAATEYRPDLGRAQCGQVHDPTAAALGGVAGHAGLFASAGEVAAYAQLWLGGGNLGGVQLLSPATVALALRDQTGALGGERFGLGWMLRSTEFSSSGDLFSAASFGHTGFTGTSVWADPERDLLAVLLTNRLHLARSDHLRRLRPRFHNAVAAAAR